MSSVSSCRPSSWHHENSNYYIGDNDEDSSQVPRQQRERKAVSFADNPVQRTRLVRSLRPLAPLIWWTADELYDTKTDASQLAEALEATLNGGQLLSTATYHEEWTAVQALSPLGYWRAYKARIDVTNAVLDAQDSVTRRNGTKSNDDKNAVASLLARASRDVSFSSVGQARERAQMDARDVQHYLHASHHGVLNEKVSTMESGKRSTSSPIRKRTETKLPKSPYTKDSPSRQKMAAVVAATTRTTAGRTNKKATLTFPPPPSVYVV